MDPTTEPSFWTDAYGKLAVLIQMALVAAGACVGPVLFLELVFTPLEKVVAALRPALMPAWKGIAGTLKPLLCLPLGTWAVMQAHNNGLINLGIGPMGWQKAALLGLLGSALAPFLYTKFIRPWLPWTNGAPATPPPSGG